MQELNLTYATRSIQVRRIIDVHREWIESRLGVSLSEAIILETEIPFYNAALPWLGYFDHWAEVSTPLARLIEQLQFVESPPTHAPYIELTEERAVGRPSLKRLMADANDSSSAYAMNLVNSPVMLQLRDTPYPIVALSVKYYSGPPSTGEEGQDIILIPRSGMAIFIAQLKTLTRPDGKPRLKMGHDEQILSRCDWDQLVLDPTIVSLLRDDFESFFQREDWYRRMRLPYRRGYLLHGAPGNGKSTAVRAMLTSRGLTAHSLRFFDSRTDDNALERLFARAAKDAPSVVLLEDIDRCFPRAGSSKTNVSLQALLNCLDGVASQEGIITLATANEPTALDPAILRRPGRFDRVICFANPTPELRHQYFRVMHPAFAEANLDQVVEESAGFSFAQLRECFIMAAQQNFGSDREIEVAGLLNSIWSLRGSTLVGSLKSSAGFASPAANGQKAS
jgi:hypothetical protein